MAADESSAATTESAWLIEHPHKPGRPRYWTEIDSQTGVGTWTSNPWQATRYATQDDAELAMRRWVVHPTVLEARAVSHGFAIENYETRLFVRFYAVGPREDTGKLRRALDDLLVGDIDWPESIDWALSAEPADDWLIDLLQDMREGNTKLLRPVEARSDDDLADAVRSQQLGELEARQNELHMAMREVESMPASEAQTACIIKLGERMRLLVELRGKSEVGRSL